MNAIARTPTSQTVEKTIRILDYFSLETPELTASEVAERLQMPFSTVFRLLATLLEVGFLDLDPVTHRYRLGLRLLELGYMVSQQLDLPRVAAPILQRLAQEAQETAHLSIRDGDVGVFVAKLESSQSIRMHTPLGRRVPLHAGASMKVILAFLSDAEIRTYIQRAGLHPRTSRTVTDPEQLWQQLRQIREQGYALTLGEQTEGAAGLAMPVRDHTGVVVAGLTISGPEYRFTPERLERFLALLHEASAQLSAELGYRPRSNSLR